MPEKRQTVYYFLGGLTDRGGGFLCVLRQVKLSLGRASRSEVTPASDADLVIDFEILPPRKATAESIQLFFDRRWHGFGQLFETG